jgi:pimeloyl-ACP methyl ester carboxylesterase
VAVARAQWNNARMFRLSPLAPVAGLALAAVLAAGASTSVAAAAEPTPASAGSRSPARIELKDCRLASPAGNGTVGARCGTLVVPENYADPSVRRISLRIAVVASLDRTGAREPLFVVSGGPGQASTDFYAAYAPAFAEVAKSRDIVLVDQRGTGGSNALKCDFPDDFETGTPSPELLRRLSAQCRTGLKAPPQYYTTSVAVRDLDEVRDALGYAKIALYGVSYGTRVVQHYVRKYPAHASAVILDGVIPPDRPLGPDTPRHAQEALDLMFRRCAADAACNGAFPDLARRFDDLRGRLVVTPVRMTLANPSTGKSEQIDFGSEQLIGAVRLLNYQTATTALLPLLLDRAAKGDLAPLASQLLMLGSSLDDQLAYGMNAAVICTEDVPYFGAVDRTAFAKSYFGTTQLDGLGALCDGWPKGVLDADFREPLHSAVPALLLSGEADPVTPPESGARAAKGFSDALHVVVKGQGHGQITVGCAPRLVAQFLKAGTARGLDASCLETARPGAFFVDFSGPAP